MAAEHTGPTVSLTEQGQFWGYGPWLDVPEALSPGFGEPRWNREQPDAMIVGGIKRRRDRQLGAAPHPGIWILAGVKDEASRNAVSNAGYELNPIIQAWVVADIQFGARVEVRRFSPS